MIVKFRSSFLRLLLIGILNKVMKNDFGKVRRRM